MLKQKDGYNFQQRWDCQDVNIIDSLNIVIVHFCRVYFQLLWKYLYQQQVLQQNVKYSTLTLAFSTLRRVRTELRSTADEDRLSGLCTESIHREHLK